MGIGYGMGFYSGLPVNYQNNLYWMYLLQTMQQTQQMQQAQYEQTMQRLEQQRQQQQLQQQQAAAQQSQTSQSAVTTQQNQAEAPVDTVTTSQQTTTVPAPQQTGDGKDDGKISFGKKCKNFVKGIGNFFKGMVCDENGKFSIKRTLTTAAVAAGAVALTVATGGAATPFLVAAGATLATVQTGKGVYKAVTAKTDAEAEAAWQEIGSGTTALVGSVAGAKGALKASGASVPKGNAVTSSLRATRDCFKISGEAALNGGKTLFTQSPVKTAGAIRGYYQNTVKPNMQQAFSYKNGHKNYTEAIDKKLNKDIKDIDAQIAKLQEKLADNPGETRAKYITKQIDKLNKQKLISQERLLHNAPGDKVMNGFYYKNIKEVEATLADPNISATEKNMLKTYRAQLYQAADDFNSQYKIRIKNTIANREQRIQKLKDDIKIASKDAKPALKAELKTQEAVLNGIKKQYQVEMSQWNVQKAEAYITRLNDQLRTASTDAQKQSIASRIVKIEKSIAKDKQILRNANYQTAAQTLLPEVGLAYGSYYLANPAPQVSAQESGNDNADAIAQSYGFESAAAMQEYINAMNSSQQALNNADEFLSSQQQQNATNPYNTGMFAMQPPVGSGLGFEDLYASPYPAMY